MITESTVRNVTKFGDVVEASYTIEDSAKIFGILRSNIYSDKILAVIREYSTNGWDGHVMAGTPHRPIQVTLPTSLLPSFKIRDFGVGLSEDSVMHIYTSYGTSTKDKSNDFNGTFGLGSKSAFAYGNTFGITSYFNGTKTLFTAYLDETNIGKIRKEYSEPTSEENGVEIEIAVKHSDISAFNETAGKFYKFFNPCPIILGGNSDVASSIRDFHFKEKVAEGSNWYILPSDGPYWNRVGSVVRMGNVAYPLNHDALNWNDDKRKGIVIKNAMVIDVPIGSVSITASREALEYDKRTQAYLINCICDIHAEMVQQAQDKIDNASTFWESATILNSMGNIDASVTNNVKFDKWAKVHPSTTSNYYGQQTVTLEGSFIQKNIKEKFGVELRSYSYFNSPRLPSQNVSYIVPSNRVIFVLNVPGNKVKKEEIGWRMRGANRVYPNKELILVNFANNNSKEFKDSALKGAKFVNIEDFEIVKYTSNRHCPPRKAIANNDLSKVKIFTFKTDELYDKYTKSNNWQPEDNDLIKNGSGVYLFINGYDSIDSNGISDMTQFHNMIENIKKLNIAIPKIYGIRDSVGKDKLNNGWESFKDWTARVVNDFIAKNQLEDLYSDFIAIHSLTMVDGTLFQHDTYSYWASKRGFHLIKNDTFGNYDIKDFSLMLDQTKKDAKANKMAIVESLESTMKFKIKTVESNIPVTLKNLEDKYPALCTLLNSEYRDVETGITELNRYFKYFNKEQEKIRIVM